MVSQKEPHVEESSVHSSSNWFDEMIALLKTDRLILETGTADERKKELYATLMSGNDLKLASLSRQSSSRIFFTHMMVDYMAYIEEYNAKPIKLSADISNSKILLWAEIENNDETTEDGLYLAEARVNAKFYEDGHSLSTTIVERCDNIAPPPHYSVII